MDEAEDEAHHAEVHLLELLMAGGEPPELLRLAEAALDPIPFLGDLGHHLIPGPRLRAVRPVRDHRRRVVLLQHCAAARVGVEPLVAQDLVAPPQHLGRRGQDRLCQRGVVPLSLGDIEGDHAALIASDGDDLGRQATARPADRVGRGAPLFFGAPAAF